MGSVIMKTERVEGGTMHKKGEWRTLPCIPTCMQYGILSVHTPYSKCSIIPPFILACWRAHALTVSRDACMVVCMDLLEIYVGGRVGRIR